MRRITLFVLFFGSIQVFAQPSVSSRLESAKKLRVRQADAVADRVHTKVDSLQNTLDSVSRFDLQRAVADVLHRNEDAVDSVRKRQAFDSLSTRWYFMRDSLSSLRLSPDQYTRRLDSLGNNFYTKNLAVLQDFEQEAQNPFAEIRTKLPVDVNAGAVSSVGFQTPALGLRLEESLKNVPAGGVSGVSGIQGQFSKVGDVPQEQLQKIQTHTAIQNTRTRVNDLQQITDRTQAYSKDIQEIANGGAARVEELPKSIEAQALKVDEVAEFQKQMNGASEYQSLATQNDPEALKELAKRELLEAAPDHFANQHAALQSAMSTLADAKKHHSSLNSLAELRKRHKLFMNSLEGRPFKERFRPGLMFQAMNGRDTLVLHTFPTFTYKLSGAISVGVGGYYRVVELKKEWKLAQRDPWWGFIAYGSVRLFKSVHFRAEVDAINAKRTGSNEGSNRDWVCQYLAGIQKEFRLSRRLTGQAMFLHSFQNRLSNTIPEKLNLRVGIEYALVSGH